MLGSRSYKLMLLILVMLVVGCSWDGRSVEHEVIDLGNMTEEAESDSSVTELSNAKNEKDLRKEKAHDVPEDLDHEANLEVMDSSPEEIAALAEFMEISETYELAELAELEELAELAALEEFEEMAELVALEELVQLEALIEAIEIVGLEE